MQNAKATDSPFANPTFAKEGKFYVSDIIGNICLPIDRDCWHELCKSPFRKAD
jgi:hypothetical protein